MKGFTVGIYVMIAVVFLLIVLALGFGFIMGAGGEFESSDGGYRRISADECKTHLDCPGNELCLSIDGSAYKCSCLDNRDCGVSKECINNKCV